MSGASFDQAGSLKILETLIKSLFKSRKRNVKAETTSEKSVDMAFPFMPILNVKIKRGSNKQLMRLETAEIMKGVFTSRVPELRSK
jgi:hypothetical protein